MLEYADYLGIDTVVDSDLLFIAREGLKAPLPDAWKACKSADRGIYFYNFESGESKWEHPLDEVFRAKYKELKDKKP